jgi:hypothetical protein
VYMDQLLIIKSSASSNLFFFFSRVRVSQFCGRAGKREGGHQVWPFWQRLHDPNFLDAGPLPNGGSIRQEAFSGAIGQWAGRMARH